MNLLLAFILEVIALFGFAGLGFLLPVSSPWRGVASLLLFIALVIFWGRFMAPTSSKKVGLRAYYIAKYIIYTLAAVTLAYVYTPFLSLGFMVISIINDAMLFGYNKQRLRP